MTAIRLNYYLRRRTAAIIGCIQFVMVAFTVYVGASDSISSLTFGSRLRGALFLIVGVVLFVGFVAIIVIVRTDIPQWGPLALAGSILSCAVGLSMIALQWQGGDHLERLFIYWGPMTVACGYCVFALFRAGITVTNPGRLTAVLSVSTLLSAVNFLYPNIYVPSASPHILQLSVSFGKPVADENKTLAAIPVTIKAKNTTNVRIYALGSMFAVAGRNVRTEGDASVRDAVREAIDNGSSVNRYVKVVGYDLLLADEIVNPEFFFEPMEEYSTTRIVRCRIKDSYDVLRLEAEFIIVRGDRLVPILRDHPTSSWNDRAQNVGDPAANDFVRWTYSVEEGSTIRKMTRAPAVLTVWRTLESPQLYRPRGHYLLAQGSPVGKTLQTPESYSPYQMLKRYGLATTGVPVAEYPLWEVKK